MLKAKEHLMELIKGPKQPIEIEEKDWGEDDMDDEADMMENEQEDVLPLPMQPMTLTAKGKPRRG